MAGLEKIITQIQEESRAQVQSIAGEAAAEAQRIREAALAEADKECAEIERRSKQSVKQILARGKSAAELKKGQGILTQKQELIREAIEGARRELKSMDEERYFDCLIKLAVKSAHPGTGKMVLSAEDKKRLPADFEKKLNGLLAEKGASLEISEETRDMGSGFVLVYGGIEENGDFDDLIDSAYERLQDIAHKALFSADGQEG